MEQELIYIWLNDRRCLRDAEFELSPEYSVSFRAETNQLSIQRREGVNVFRRGNIMNLSAVIGENGTGKTTFLQFLNSLACLPLRTAKDARYDSDTDERNAREMFLAVFRTGSTLRVVNKTGHTVRWGDREIPPLSRTEPRDALPEAATHIYFTNSEYASDSNMFQRNIDHISIFNAALFSVARNFYNYTVMYGEHSPALHEPNFDNFQQLLIRQKGVRDFQQILDVLFLHRMRKYERQDEYLGKSISSVRLSFSSVLADIDNFLSRSSAGPWTDILFKARQRFLEIATAASANAYDPYETLIVNLAFELHVLFDFQPNGTDAKNLLRACTDFIGQNIDDTLAVQYYLLAVQEIGEVAELSGVGVSTNAIPKDDLAHRQWYDVSVSALGKLMERWKLRRGVSFIAKYLSVDGLSLSSGERALLNLASRIEMLDYLSLLEGREHYSTRENILFLFDEIDLYVHPNAQRRLISVLLKQIGNLFRGHNVQIVISSHSPIVLSDIPRENTTYLIKGEETSVVRAGRDLQQTFAANIPSLYRNSFFLEGGVGVGDFALGVINNIARRLHGDDLSDEEYARFERIIGMIGEPVLKRKLEEMLAARRPQVVWQRDFDRAYARERQGRLPQQERDRYAAFLHRQRELIEEEIERLEREDHD